MRIVEKKLEPSLVDSETQKAIDKAKAMCADKEKANDGIETRPVHLLIEGNPYHTQINLIDKWGYVAGSFIKGQFIAPRGTKISLI